MTPAYECQGQAVSREEFYRRACDPQRHVAVEACAGAGKTWMLVSRIVRALLDDVQPYEILAITFTKKAAGEMRGRLASWLAEFALADDTTLVRELRARGVSEGQASGKVEALRQLQGRLLEDSRPVQIRTFHSWFAALLRHAPFSVLQDMGLPPGFELLEDDTRAVKEVWRPFHARVRSDPGLLADFECLVRQYGRSSLSKALNNALARRIEFRLADDTGIAAESVPRLGQWAPQFAGLPSPQHRLLDTLPSWRSWAATLGQEKNKTPRNAADAIVRALELVEQQGESGLPEAFQTLRDRFFVKNEDRLTQHLEKIEAAREAEVELQAICAALRQQQAWEHQQRMVRLTRGLIEEYGRLKRERRWVDMNDVESAALRLLGDPVAGAWVQQQLDTRTRHLLIDEFQDTNPLQWQALHAWLSSYAGSGGGSQAPRLFIVGDPKQSIYRFRRAEPQVFLAAQSFVQELGGELLSCDHTRRNAPVVLGVVNAALQQAAQAGEFNGFRTHTTESAELGQVLALPRIARTGAPEKDIAAGWRDSLTTPRITEEESLRQLECRQVAHWIVGQIAAGQPAAKIMVLARKRDRLAVMEAELRRLGIAAQQPEKRDLGEMPEVQDVIALIDALVSPTHDLSLARALKSPVLGATDDMLVELAQLQRHDRSCWLELILKTPWTPTSPWLDLQVRLARWQGWLVTLPPHDALQAIYGDGDVLARYLAAVPANVRRRVQTHLLGLLTATLELDGGRYATPYALVRALRGGSIQAPALAGDAGVSLLTVHGAKGLEADIVVLLDTDAPPPNDQTMSLLVDWPGQALAPRSLVFLASEKVVAPSAEQAMEQERAERRREEINALYVALTRACRVLVLSAVEPARDSGLSWWKRLQALAREEQVPASEQTAGALSSDIVLYEVPEPDVSVCSEQNADAIVATAEARIGSAMHRLLEWAPLNPGAPEASSIARVRGEFDLDEAQARTAAAQAMRILQGDGAWAWSQAEVLWHGNEVAIMRAGGMLRMDRLVQRRDGDWWVLDYKSASRPEDQPALRRQLLGYREAVQAVHPESTVRAAFLSASGSISEIK